MINLVGSHTKKELDIVRGKPRICRDCQQKTSASFGSNNVILIFG